MGTSAAPQAGTGSRQQLSLRHVGIPMCRGSVAARWRIACGGRRNQTAVGRAVQALVRCACGFGERRRQHGRRGPPCGPQEWPRVELLASSPARPLVWPPACPLGQARRIGPPGGLACLPASPVCRPRLSAGLACLLALRPARWSAGPPAQSLARLPAGPPNPCPPAPALPVRRPRWPHAFAGPPSRLAARPLGCPNRPSAGPPSAGPRIRALMRSFVRSGVARTDSQTAGDLLGCTPSGAVEVYPAMGKFDRP